MHRLHRDPAPPIGLTKYRHGQDTWSNTCPTQAERAAIWDKLVYPSSNIRLVICGHECHPTTDYFETVGFRTDKNAAGKSVAQMMFNAQTADGQWHGNGGDCWLRILEFLPDGRTVEILDQTRETTNLGVVEAGDKGCTVRGSADTWSARTPWSATHDG